MRTLELKDNEIMVVGYDPRMDDKPEITIHDNYDDAWQDCNSIRATHGSVLFISDEKLETEHQMLLDEYREEEAATI
jgi:hypothetical protein